MSFVQSFWFTANLHQSNRKQYFVLKFILVLKSTPQKLGTKDQLKNVWARTLFTLYSCNFKSYSYLLTSNTKCFPFPSCTLWELCGTIEVGKYVESSVNCLNSPECWVIMFKCCADVIFLVWNLFLHTVYAVGALIYIKPLFEYCVKDIWKNSSYKRVVCE